MAQGSVGRFLRILKIEIRRCSKKYSLSDEILICHADQLRSRQCRTVGRWWLALSAASCHMGPTRDRALDKTIMWPGGPGTRVRRIWRSCLLRPCSPTCFGTVFRVENGSQTRRTPPTCRPCGVRLMPSTVRAVCAMQVSQVHGYEVLKSDDRM